MSIENETADQVVKMILQGSEVVLRLSGEGAMRIATMIYTALKGDMTTKGRATLWEFLKSGKSQKLFTIPDSHLKAFTTASKKFGFPFVILKDKNGKDGYTDIMVYATDASKVNRVLENLKLTVKQVDTIKPEVKTETGELIKPLGMQYSVPLDMIDNIPEPPKHDRRLLAELQKYAAKIKQNGPQVIETVGLLCKPDGRYEVLPGQGSKRLMSLRLAGYKAVVADISVPKKEGVEVKAENVGERDEVKPDVNPTTARTKSEPASGRDLGQKSKEDECSTISADPEKRPSVREKLQKAKAISAEKQAAKELAKKVGQQLPKSNLR